LIQTHKDCRNTAYAHLSIKDNGAGILPHHIPYLFDPFFTTKDVGEGIGLGLAMVYGVLQKYEGFIDLESHVGEGSTFHLYIPLARSEDD